MKPQPLARHPQADRIEVLRSSLAQVVARSTKGVVRSVTPIPDLTLYRQEAATTPTRCLVEPSVALVVQGAKHALLGEVVYAYDIHRFLITSLDLPAMMQVVEASRQRPYLGLSLRLDLRVMAEVVAQSGLPPAREHPSERGMVLGETSPPLLEAFKRLLDLLEEPAAIPVLAPLIVREIHYRLLMSNQGARLWQIASVGSQSHRIARAIEWLKVNFARPLRINELAAQVQMSSSNFHHHFRLLTAMTPLQYQKWLRLNEARRLMLAEHIDAATAAFQVGYESPSQFSREYSRLFGVPPRRDIAQLRRL